MFTIPLKSSGDTSLSSTSSTSFSYTDAICLTPKWFDHKDMALKVDIQCYANTVVSSDSGQLFVYPAIAETSGGTYVAFATDSGTSLVVTSGTSVSGPSGNGSYFVPLTIVNTPGVGVTMALHSTPYIKFGHRAYLNTVNWKATLCIG